jgi:hypothetical protein
VSETAGWTLTVGSHFNESVYTGLWQWREDGNCCVLLCLGLLKSDLSGPIFLHFFAISLAGATVDIIHVEK